MKTVALPRSTRRTPPLGFGCAYLTGGFEARRSRALVDAAFDAGFRHFDVAPPYGLGTAEDVLGDALRGRRDDVALVSKVGLARPDMSRGTQLKRLIATPLRRFAPDAVKARLRRPSGPGPRPDFSPAAVEASIAQSLRRLRTDHLDALLLHEARPADVSDELLTLLDKRRQAGVLRTLGIASSLDAARAIAAAAPGVFDMAQYAWSPLDPPHENLAPGLFRVTHRGLLRAFGPLRAKLAADPALARRLCDATGLDLTDGAVLANVLIGATLAHNPGGLALVGTRRKSRIFANAQAMRDDALFSAGAALLAALESEKDLPAPDAR
ncbi:aldo/keto reductase [Methylocella sp.]|uniref:aldo/keto reductase n=1 Tax=Methylocella sp. TaxID=1978226 RepID=UPI0037838C44